MQRQPLSSSAAFVLLQTRSLTAADEAATFTDQQKGTLTYMTQTLAHEGAEVCSKLFNTKLVLGKESTSTTYVAARRLRRKESESTCIAALPSMCGNPAHGCGAWLLARS